MSLELFLQENQEQAKNVKYAATETIKDKKGKPVEWEFRQITQDEVTELRKLCTREVPDNIRKGAYREKVDSARLTNMLITATVVYPDLTDVKLQDSYGVKSAEDLLKKLVYKPGEYNALAEFFNQNNGFTKSFDEEVEEAKN